MREAATNIWRHLKRYRSVRWSVYFLSLLVVVALLADFIAGENPLLWKDGEGIRSPLLQQYIGEIRHGGSYIQSSDYKTMQPDWAVWPLIRFGTRNIDRRAGGLAAPFKAGHPLGTDEIGRDVAAGLVHGTRISLLVSVLAVFLAGIIGLVLGMPPGFYGDHKLKIGLIPLLIYLTALPFLFFYAGILSDLVSAVLLKGIAFLAVVVTGLFLIGLVIRAARLRMGTKWAISFPMDILFMRLVEIFKALPALYIILSLLVLVEEPGIGTLVLLIAFLMWVSFGRFIRGEFLSLREQPFVKRFLLEGKSDPSVMFYHLLPNAVTPLIVLAAFAMGSAIILESTLSFLGLGLPPDYVSWGSIMNQARANIGAWWLALFPGLAILCTVLAFNAIGRAVNELLRENIRYES